MEADAIAPPAQNGKPLAAKSSKKSKKKNKDVWITSSRKGKKKTKHASNNNHNSKNAMNGDNLAADRVFITPIPRFPDKNDDSPESIICLSKVYKAEKVKLNEDRLTAGSTKGYRMVRATRGMTEGAWYFEINVVHLGETGHTRLGWTTEKGDLQAPVGYNANSFGYSDIDGSKVHKALREKYGNEGYKEGDVIGFYINLPDGGSYAPNPPRLVWHKGQRYICAPNVKEDSLKVVPGSEISYFKNGICQGVAFSNLYGGRYFPAASMYTLPNQPPCVVKFNFGPDFEKFPEDFGERPLPRAMIEVPYQSYDDRVENGVSSEKMHFDEGLSARSKLGDSTKLVTKGVRGKSASEKLTEGLVKFSARVANQIDVVRSLNDAEGPQWKHSLFGNPNDLETFRRRCEIAETLAEKNFDLAFQVIYEFNLPAVDIYAGVAAALAERKKGGQLTEFFRNIKGTIDDEDWDQVLEAAINVYANRHKELPDRLIDMLTSSHRKVLACVVCGRLKSAFQIASRSGSVADVQYVAHQALHSNAIPVLDMCKQWLAQYM